MFAWRLTKTIESKARSKGRRPALRRVVEWLGFAAMLFSVQATTATLEPERHSLDMRVDAVRAAMKAMQAVASEDAPSRSAALPEGVAQWYNWPNWNNWYNWPNWGNWNNWSNWGNWFNR